MLVFIMMGLTTFVCNIGQGQCIFISPAVMNGMITAGVIELFFEGMYGTIKVFRKKSNDDDE